jgi:hypothetical protein
MITGIALTALIVDDSEKAIEFLETPREEAYGKVAVFKDLYGNRIDLIEPKKLS